MAVFAHASVFPHTLRHANQHQPHGATHLKFNGMAHGAWPPAYGPRPPAHGPRRMAPAAEERLTDACDDARSPDRPISRSPDLPIAHVRALSIYCYITSISSPG